MRAFIALLSAIVLWPASSSAQLASPNASGIAFGHLHYHVRDVEAYKKFWSTLGATPTKFGETDVMKLSNVLIFLTKGDSAGGNEGSVVKHVTFRVPNLMDAMAKFEAAGIKTQPNRNKLQGYVFTPDGEEIELFQELTEISGFKADAGHEDAAVDRLAQKMTVPITTHHVHLYVPEGADPKAKEWYVKTFGGVPGKRWNYDATFVPGILMNFSETKEQLVPTKGRMLDHIGFEVKNLEAFCKKLEASGVKFDVPYRKANGIAIAFLTDPWGTYIELTEGLDKL